MHNDKLVIKRPLDEPEVGVAGQYAALVQLRVGHVALHAVPHGIGLESVHVDGDGHVALELQVFVVHALVDVVLGQLPRLEPLLQALHALLPRMGVLLGALLGLGDYQAYEAALVYDLDIAVLQEHGDDGRLHGVGLVLHPRTYYIFVAVLGQLLDVRLGKQNGVGDHDGMVEEELLRQSLYGGDEGLPLEDVALENLIADGAAARRDEKTEEYLRAGVLAVLGEARLAKVVLLPGLEIQRGHVVEHYADLAPALLLRPFVGYALHLRLDVLALMLYGLAILALLAVLLLPEAEVVEELVDGLHVVEHAKVAAQGVHRAKLAAGVEQATDGQMAEHVIMERAVAYPVIQAAVDELGAYHPDMRVGDAGEELLQAGLERVVGVHREQRASQGVDVLPSLALQLLQFTLIATHAQSLDDLIATAVSTFLLDNHTVGAGLVGFSLYKHGAKIA